SDEGRVQLPPAPDGDVALPVTVVRGRVTVRAERGADGALPAIAARADRALAESAADLPGLPVPAHVEVRGVRDAADLARAAPPGRGARAWAAGVAFPDLGVVVVALHRGGDVLDVAGTTAHEMAHLALGAAFGAAGTAAPNGSVTRGGPRAPRWLHEGFAW